MMYHFAVHFTSPSLTFCDLAIPYDTRGVLVFGEQVWPGERGNYSLPIYAHEILFASEEAATEFRKDKDDNGKHVIADGDPKKLEFRKCFPLFRVTFFLHHSHLYPLLSSYSSWKRYAIPGKILFTRCHYDLAEGSQRGYQDASQGKQAH